MGIFPPILQNLKIEIKGKGKERIRKVTYLLFTLYLILISGRLLVFFDDELTTFRNKNYGFICNVKKSKKALWSVKEIFSQ